jgi:hypothetical protein
MTDILSIQHLLDTPDKPFGNVEGVGDVAHVPNDDGKPKCVWEIEKGADKNYRKLGKLLSACGDLFRGPEDETGLILLRPSGKSFRISRAKDLIPVVVDRIKVVVTKGGKVTRELPAQNHFDTMLCTEEFLDNFLPVDEVTNRPVYLKDFTLAQPGYNDGGPGDRILFVGDPVQPAKTTEIIDTFLDVMEFASNADRTNTVAAALTCKLSRMWHGGKPAIIVTATKSHAGKGTITEFIRGSNTKASVPYQTTDWPMMSQFQRQLKLKPDIGFVVFDNVRLDSSGGRGNCIRSAFIESFVTSDEVILACPTSGTPICGPNKFVIAINTNDGKLSPDLMNRALPIHLEPKGDILDRKSSIGNPLLEFLPKNAQRIESELHGMIDRWKRAGQPLDKSANHSMTPWAQTIGGILKVNGYADFLANYGSRRISDDPIRDALATLGAATPDESLRPAEWADLAVKEGLAKTLISPNERDTPKGRERAIGRVLSKHLKSTFEASTETTRYRLQLEGGYLRWEPGSKPQKRYVFNVLDEHPIPLDQ